MKLLGINSLLERKWKKILSLCKRVKCLVGELAAETYMVSTTGGIFLAALPEKKYSVCVCECVPHIFILQSFLGSSLATQLLLLLASNFLSRRRTRTKLKYLGTSGSYRQKKLCITYFTFLLRSSEDIYKKRLVCCYSSQRGCPEHCTRFKI